MICDPSVGEEQNDIFEKVYYAVRYIFNEAKLKKDSSYMSPKIQLESFVLLYERLEVIMWICLLIHIQNKKINPENEEIKLLWYKE